MRSHLTPKRLLPALQCLALLFGATDPIDFTSSAEAATSAEKRETRALKKKNRILTKQNRNLSRQLAAALLPDPVPSFIEMVTVGNQGNANDPEDGDAVTGGVQNFGAVAETFQIGKYEVTNAQYAEFLEAVAETDTNGLFDSRMETDARGGIVQFGTSPNFHYAVKPFMGDKPVNFVDFWDCCRFCNWLHNGMPSGAQNSGTTETGAYDLTVLGAIASNTVTRSPGALFFIPTEDQWYKAAYHDPRTAASNGPPGDDNYWLYPMQSDGPGFPIAGTVDAIGEITNDTANIANYDSAAIWDSNGDEADENGNLTAVGSGGPGSASFYGACDMGGNVSEWSESILFTSFRGLRGGSWGSVGGDLRASSRNARNPADENSSFGFRVASP